MSTATTTPPPAVGLPATATPWRAVRWTLARVEGRRLLRHPLFVLGMVGAVLAIASDADSGESISALAGGAYVLVPSGAATFLAACFAASRERRDAAHDLYAAVPLSPRVRTEAALLSIGWAGLTYAAHDGHRRARRHRL